VNNRRRWQVDVLPCVFGHATYAPDEPELATRLSVQTPTGHAWVCLRCGSYVVGEPSGAGPAEHAPLVLRGRALEDAILLRVFGVLRIMSGIVFLVAAFGIWRFNGSRAGLRATLATYLPLVQPIADHLGIKLTDFTLMRYIEEILDAKSVTVLLVAGFVALYASLHLTEGTGLWLMKRWGEYVAAVGTSLFVPLEVYELVNKFTVVRVLVLLVNLFLVAYLVLTKRLFGARGGHKAYEAERSNESLLEIQKAAAEAERDSAGVRKGSRRTRSARARGAGEP
jgi:uncharacterized membrane protein (DUF2068 family)